MIYSTEDRFRVCVEAPARAAIGGLGDVEAGRIVAALELLAVDPWIRSERKGETSSALVAMLVRRGYHVRRLKIRDVSTLRVFYFVDEMTRTVLVKEIVERDADTYDQRAPHVRRITDNYRRYFAGEGVH